MKLFAIMPNVMTKIINELLQKELTRKQFLGVVGAGAFSMIGLSALLPSFGESVKRVPSRSSGYGSGIYVTAKRGKSRK